MSRIGKKPIEIPSGVEVGIENQVVTVKGLSKSQFTTFLFSQAKEICLIHKFDKFSIVERIDTIEEVNE